MTDDVLYRPSEWQQRFHSLTKLGVRHALGAGAAGPGKTTCLLFDAVDQVTIEHERCQNTKHKHHIQWGTSKGWILHLRRTRLQLEQTIQLAKRAFVAIDPGVEWNEQRSTFTFSSGLKYQFGHCKDPNDWENYMSFEFTAIYFDELTQFNEEQYDQICTRLRTTDPVLMLMLKVRSMSNPLMRKEGTDNFVINDPNWVRRRFVDPNPMGNQIFWKKLKMGDGSTVRVGSVYMPARLRDNPDKVFVKQYEATLREQPLHIQKALLEGDWYVTVGSFFAEYWEASLHVCKPFMLPGDWRFFRSMDWGFKAFGCIHWWALDDEDTLYCAKELKFKGKTPEEVAAMIEAVESAEDGPLSNADLWDSRRHSSRITGVADTQLWEQRGHSGKNMAEVFREKGIEWRPADKKSRQTNAGHIIKRLTDHEDRTKSPGLIFFESCRYIIQTLPAIQTSQSNSEEPADGGDDHGYDTCLGPETRVLTSEGWCEIQHLADGALVLSTDGKFWPCRGGVKTGSVTRLFRVSLDNGLSFLATEDHRVLTRTGEWKRVDQLDAQCYCVVPWIRLSCRPHAKNSLVSVTTFVENISVVRRTRRSFIGSSGKPTRAVRRALGTTFTTITTIARTIASRISLSCRRAFIRVFTVQSAELPEICNTPSSALKMQPAPGTAQMSAEHGIESTQKAHFMPTREAGGSVASSVALRQSTEEQAEGLGSAQPRAQRSTEGLPESITRNEYALPVGKISWSAGMKVRPLAVGDAHRVTGVAFERWGDVWCTMVPKMGAFVIEGATVSNCAYGVAFASKGKAAIPPKRAPKDEWEEEDAPAAVKRRGRHGYGQELC